MKKTSKLSKKTKLNRKSGLKSKKKMNSSKSSSKKVLNRTKKNRKSHQHGGSFYMPLLCNADNTHRNRIRLMELMNRQDQYILYRKYNQNHLIFTDITDFTFDTIFTGGKVFQDTIHLKQINFKITNIDRNDILKFDKSGFIIVNTTAVDQAQPEPWRCRDGKCCTCLWAGAPRA